MTWNGICQQVQYFLCIKKQGCTLYWPIYHMDNQKISSLDYLVDKQASCLADTKPTSVGTLCQTKNRIYI